MYQFKSESEDILEMPIADGLKDLLIDHGITRQKILKKQPTDLASLLGIDEYVAIIVQNAAKYKPSGVR